MIRIERVDTADSFEAIRDEWNDLARRDGPPLPYARHEWLAAWWRGFGAHGTLSILLAREGGSLVAAAPLMRAARTIAGVPVRALHTLGVNAGFPDLLRDPSRPDALGSVLEAALHEGGADLLLARGTPAGGAKEAWLRDWLTRSRERFDARPCDEVYLDARGGLGAYRAGRPEGLWSQTERNLRKLGARASARFERVVGPASWEGPLDEAFDVSLRSWKADAGGAIGRLAEYRVFLLELARRFGERGEAELCLLRVNGRSIAFRFGVRDRDVFVDHEIAYDREWGRYGPGNLVARHSDEALVREGVSEINLGAPFSWKAGWAPVRRTRVEWVVYRAGSIRAALARAARGVRARWEARAARARPRSAAEALPCR